VVTLDKVICCYPDMPALVRASADKADAVYAITVPRDGAWTRGVMACFNWFMRNVLRKQFQAFIHPHREIDGACAERELALSERDHGLFWCVRIYRRAPAR
jgi:magnesium-protoporphyrin O-methyltransferase